jgi:hypothetical protein
VPPASVYRPGSFLGRSAGSARSQWADKGARNPGKYEPLQAFTVLQLAELILPAHATHNLHARRPGGTGYPLPWCHRDVDRNCVASQYQELCCAGGNTWETIGTSWNGSERIAGFDIDYSEKPEPGSRGCNHPTFDNGAAEQALRAVIWEATGGDLIPSTSLHGHGRWHFAVVPEGVDGRDFVRYVLGEMQARGFKVGPGCLEAPLGVARLPLAGYALDDYASKPWIEQVGELVRWIHQQQNVVRMRIALPESSKPPSSTASKHCTKQVSGSQPRSVDLGGICWTSDHRSNGFVNACAKRFALNGHDESSAALLAAMIGVHPEWLENASQESKKDLDYWCIRAMKSAALRYGSGAKQALGKSNQERHAEWNNKIRIGTPKAIEAGCCGVTAVVEWLAANMGMSKRLLWERAELIRQGIDAAVSGGHAVGRDRAGSSTPTQSTRMGVTGATYQPLQAGPPASPCSLAAPTTDLLAPSAHHQLHRASITMHPLPNQVIALVPVPSARPATARDPSRQDVASDERCGVAGQVAPAQGRRPNWNPMGDRIHPNPYDAHCT